MNSPLGLIPALLRQRLSIVVWVMFLMGVNMASVFFWSEPLGLLIFVVFLVSAGMMMGLYSLVGYSRLMGLGHFLWLPLIPYVVVQIPAMDGVFQGYLIVLAITLTLSVVMDIRDVWLYFRYRAPACSR